MNDIVQTITSMGTELESLQEKSCADDNLIHVLKARVENLVIENEKLRNAHSLEASRLRNERNTALQLVEEVQGLIMAIGNQALKGIDRMRPREVVETTTVHVADARIPTVLYDQQPLQESLQLMSPVGGGVEEEIETAIRPFILRKSAAN